MEQEKGTCPHCGTENAVDLADGWTKRLDDLYGEWCRGHRAAINDMIEFLRANGLSQVADMIEEEWKGD